MASGSVHGAAAVPGRELGGGARGSGMRIIDLYWGYVDPFHAEKWIGIVRPVRPVALACCGSRSTLSSEA
eukprot:7010484-Prymnesium_polylepis.1